MIKCDETKPYIFISYSHKNSDKVMQIIDRLQNEGYNVWYDEGIDSGTELDENIAKHVMECSCFVAFISNAYIASENCKNELNYSRDLNKEQLVVYLEEVSLDEAYRKLFSAKGIEKTRNMGVYADEKTAAALITPKKVSPVVWFLPIFVVVAVIVAATLGLFEKKTIRVGDTSVTVYIGEEYTIGVSNYKEIGEPELTWTVADADIAEIKSNRDSATIIGLEAGTTDIIVSGPWCKERTVRVTVEEPLFEIEGASFETTFYEYYFMEDGTYYIISKTYLNHYMGEYSIDECEAVDVLEHLSDERVAEMRNQVDNGEFFFIELDGVNYYNGWSFDGYGYQIMYIYTNGEDTITCSTFSYHPTEISDITMKDKDDLEAIICGTN